VDGVSECDSLQRAVSLIPTEKSFSKYLRAGTDKVKSLSPHHRFAIALHSPNGVVETGLRLCPAEKKARNLACRIRLDTFSGAVCRQDLRNCGDFQRFLQ